MHGSPFQAEISTNEEDRRSIQGRIDQLAQTNQNVAFLNLMSTFRLQAVSQVASFLISNSPASCLPLAIKCSNEPSDSNASRPADHTLPT